MESRYSAPINSSTQIKNTQKYVSEDIGTVRKNFTFATAALIAIAAISGTSYGVTEENTQVKTTITTNKVNYSIAANEHIVDTIDSLVLDSQKLMKGFNFKTAQWAAVLKVERKTLYNWAKNPNTKVQEKVANRIKILSDIFDEMNEGHAHYLASFAFGRYKDPEIGESLLNENLSFSNVIEHYERLYSEFDGKYKRNKHKYTQYS